MNNKFGSKLRELRLEAGLSVRQLAERADVHYSYISKLENGLVPPPGAQKIADLADALGYDRSKLLALAERLPRSIVRNFRQRKSADFGAVLKQLRLKRGLSQAELAARTGVDATYISKMENQLIPPPSDDVIVRLAAALETKPRSLLKRAGKTHAYQQIMEQRYEAGNRRRFSMPNLLKSPLALARLALAAILVCVFSVALWNASPKPVKAVTVGVANGASATIGQAYQFTVTITVANTDVLPVQAIDIIIQSTSHPGTYTTTLSGLPIPSTPSTNVNTTINGATVSGTSGNTWGYWTSGARSGYGYRYTGGMGTTTGSGFGYGYGFTPYSGQQATMTYTISWTPPAGWSTADTYKIIVLAYLTAGNINTAFSQTTPSTFTLAAAPAGGTPGGGAPVPGTLTYDPTTGKTTTGTTVTSTQGNASVTIPAGTKATDSHGNPIAQITVTEAPGFQINTLTGESGGIGPVGADGQPVGYFYQIPTAYNFGPTGAHFDPPVTITFNVPAGIAEEVAQNSTIAYWSDQNQNWIIISNVHYDPATGTVSGTTDHFTVFALLTPIPTPTTATPTATPTATATATPTATATSTPTVIAPSPTPIVTNVPIPGPSVSSTVIVAPSSGAAEPVTGTGWLWPIIIGVIGAIAVGFVVYWGWNMRRD